jgi:outer membrane receptor protein involved in Fe transport
VNNSAALWITELWTGKLDFTWALPFKFLPTVLRFGGKWNEEARDNNNINDWHIWSYIGPGGNTVTTNAVGANVNNAWGNWANVGPQYISAHPFDMGTTNGLTVININGVKGMPPRVSRNAVSDLFHAHPEMFVHMGNPDNFYNAFIANKRDFKQTITSAYLQTDTRVNARLQVRTGLRLENTLNQLEEYDPRIRPEVIAAGFPVNALGTNGGRATTIPGLQFQYMSNPRVIRESEYKNYFPSALIKYQIMKDFEFQAGINKAISRPPIDNLTGLWVTDEQNQRVSAPNPNLPPEHSENIQTRFAYYISGRSPGQLSAQFSQNKIKNLRESFDYTAAEFGVEDEEFQTYIFRSTRISTNVRRFRNMELAYNQTLGFLPDKFRGTSFNVSYTRSYASQRRNGLAPHRVSSRLGYAYRKFNGSLGMIWRDESPDGNYGRYRRHLTQFDLSLNWRLTNRYTMYVQGRNITGRPVIWMESDPALPEGTNPHVRQMQEYGSNWVFGLRGQF